MGNVIIDEKHLQNIAKAIRYLKFDNENYDKKYKPVDMANAIYSSILLDDNDPNHLWLHLSGSSVSGNDLSGTKPYAWGILGNKGTITLKSFSNCARLREIDLSTNSSVFLSLNCFAGCPNLYKVTLPSTKASGDNITVELPNRVFADCPKLTKLIIPEGSLFPWPFEESSITKIYVKGKPYGEVLPCGFVSDIYPGLPVTPFASCPTLTDLYVPWGKGEVLGSYTKVVNGVPTEMLTDVLESDPFLKERNVTIHYNYVFTGKE